MDFDTAYQIDKKVIKLDEDKNEGEEDRINVVNKNYPKKVIVEKQKREVFFNEDGTEFKGPMHRDHIPASIGMMGMVIAFGLMALKLSIGALGLESKARETEILWGEKQEEVVKEQNRIEQWKGVKSLELKVASGEAELRGTDKEYKKGRSFFINNYFNENGEDLDWDKNGKVDLRDYLLTTH